MYSKCIYHCFMFSSKFSPCLPDIWKHTVAKPYFIWNHSIFLFTLCLISTSYWLPFIFTSFILFTSYFSLSLRLVPFTSLVVLFIYTSFILFTSYFSLSLRLVPFTSLVVLFISLSLLFTSFKLPLCSIYFISWMFSSFISVYFHWCWY